MTNESQKRWWGSRSWLMWAVLVYGGWGCSSVVPSEDAFLSSLARDCQTVIGEPEADGAFTVGAVLPLTEPDGSLDLRGQQRKLAMAHALTEINLLEGVGAKKFRIRICDTQGGWVSGATDKAKALATYLLESDEDIRAIISGASSDTTAIQTVTKPVGALLLSLSATAISLTHEAGDQLTWRMVSSDWFQGTARGAVSNGCHQSTEPSEDSEVVVLGLTNVYGASMWQVMQNITGIETEVFRYFPVDLELKNLEQMFDAAMELDPSVVVVVGSTTMAGEVFTAYLEVPVDQRPTIFLTDSNRNQEFLQLLPSDFSTERIYGTIPGASEPTDTYSTFELTFNALEGVDPAQGSFTAHSYDAVYCLALAYAHALGVGGDIGGVQLVAGLRALNGVTEEVSSVATDFTQVRSALLDGRVVNVEGASGPLDFDEYGDLPSQVEVWGIESVDTDERRFQSLGWLDVVQSGPKDYSVVNLGGLGELCGAQGEAR